MKGGGSKKTWFTAFRVPNYVPKSLSLPDGRTLSPALLAKELLLDYLEKNPQQKAS